MSDMTEGAELIYLRERVSELEAENEKLRFALGLIADPAERHSARAREIARSAMADLGSKGSQNDA